MKAEKKSLFLLTFIFLAVHIKCEKSNIHIVFTQEFIPNHCHEDSNHMPTCDHPENPWFVSELMHQSNNESSFRCSKPFVKLNPRTVASSTLRNLKNIWTRRGEDWSEDSSILARKIWRSFGGCTSQVKQLRTGAKYFSRVSKLFNKYNMNRILRKGNIIPGNKYKAQEILDVVASSLHGKKPLLRCSLESGLFSHNVYKLEKITMFFDKTFRLINAIDGKYPEQCPKDIPISYDPLELSSKPTEVIDFNSPLDLEEYYKVFEDPAVKYPTLLKDDNGHYVFEQQSDQFTCYEDDISKCKVPGTSWFIDHFAWEFNPDITFSCEPSEDFNAKNISSIEQELFDKWGAARTGHTDVEEAFGFRWKFETRCNAYFKGLDSEFKYYGKSLELFDQYNMDAILRESKIVPGNSYTYQAILNAVSKKIHGKKANIECTLEQGDVIYLDKITIYFDQNFSPIDRVDKEDSQSCPTDKMIYYRDFVVLRSRQAQPSGPYDYALVN